MFDFFVPTTASLLAGCCAKESARRTEFDFVLALCSAKQYDMQLGLVDYVTYAHRSLEVNSSSFIDPPFCEMLTQGYSFSDQHKAH